MVGCSEDFWTRGTVGFIGRQSSKNSLLHSRLGFPTCFVAVMLAAVGYALEW